MAIVSFKCTDTEAFYTKGKHKKFAAMSTVLARKLAMLDAAANLTDLLVPPGNRLEALQGNRKGQQSVRVNDQFRLCFVWTEQGPSAVECVDYP